jgi:hypothetical protein
MESEAELYVFDLRVFFKQTGFRFARKRSNRSSFQRPDDGLRRAIRSPRRARPEPSQCDCWIRRLLEYAAVADDDGFRVVPCSQNSYPIDHGEVRSGKAVAR